MHFLRTSVAGLSVVALMTACAPQDDEASTAAIDTTADTTAAASLTSIADIGLQTPESVLYDEQADIYIVSNINGEPLGTAGNGFISRIRPTGEVESLKWIDGEADGITLNAPKGMALHGDSLFVSDVDSVRVFHRTTGAPLGSHGISGASFLNDVATDSEGVVYVSDTGVDASFAPTGSDAVHRIAGGRAAPFFAAESLLQPNGLVISGEHLLVVPFGGNIILRFPRAGGDPDTLATLPAGQLDGIVRMSDGTLLVSSWEGQAIYRVNSGGQVSTVVENLEAPADLGWDSRRNRLLIPLFNGNRIEVREIR